MKDKVLTLKLLKESYGVCRFDKDESIPLWAFDGDFFSITRTEDELSVVCLEDNITEGIRCEKEWRVLKIEGPLDFSLVGILSKISSIIAKNNIGIFVVSTYDTDYILIKEKDIYRAVDVLISVGYDVIE